MATHSSILTWGIPWTEEPGGLQFPGPQKIGHVERPNNRLQIIRISGYYCKAEPSCQSLVRTEGLSRPWLSRLSTWPFLLAYSPGRPWRAQAHRLFAGLGEALRMPSDAATALVKDPRFIPWCPVCLRDFAWSFQEPPGGPLRRYSRRFLTLDIDIDTEGPLPRGPAVPRAPLLALLPSSHRAAPWGVYLLGFYLLSVLL